MLKSIPAKAGAAKSSTMRDTIKRLESELAQARAQLEEAGSVGALRDSEEQFRTLANNIQNLAWMADKNGWIYWYNRRWYEYTGTAFEEMQGWGWEKVHHPDHISRVVEFVKKAWHAKQPWELTFPLKNHAGEYRWFLTRAVPILNPHGEVAHWIGTNTDINEQKAHESHILEESRLSGVNASIGAALTGSDSLENVLSLCVAALATQLDTVFSGIWLLNDDKSRLELKANYGTLTEVIKKYQNVPAGETKIGSIAAEGTPYLSNDVANDPQLVNRRLLARHGITAFAGQPLILDSNIIGVVAIMSEHPISQNAFNVMSGSARMISLGIKRKQNEQDLREFNQMLERKVKKRTEQLTSLNAELERSNNELQDFAYVASHDLQEPLRKIRAFSDLLEVDYGPALPDEAKEYIGGLQRSSQRMGRLIEDLLTYSRVTTRAQPFVTVNLNDTLRDVLDDLQVRIGETGAILRSSELCIIQADPLQMRLLLQNLISNALKYRQTGVRPHITITSKQTDGFCTLSVKDNGIGFNEAYLDRIFTIFQRLHGRSEYSGTGVGLAICKKIVTRHGGTITAKSREGKGSTFIVTLATGN